MFDVIVSYASKLTPSPRLGKALAEEQSFALSVCDKAQSVPPSCSLSTRLLGFQGIQPFVGWVLGSMLHGRVYACFVSCSKMSNMCELTELLYMA